MIRVGLDRRWRVHLVAEIDLPISGDVVWESLRDFERFACLDLFHHALRLDRPGPEPGAAFVLEHRLVAASHPPQTRICFRRRKQQMDRIQRVTALLRPQRLDCLVEDFCRIGVFLFLEQLGALCQSRFVG